MTEPAANSLNFDTAGLRRMAITVTVDTKADVERVIGWVSQFEQIPALGSWTDSRGGAAIFYAQSLEELHRTVDYVASWDGETTPTIDDCPGCEAHA